MDIAKSHIITKKHNPLFKRDLKLLTNKLNTDLNLHIYLGFSILR